MVSLIGCAPARNCWVGSAVVRFHSDRQFRIASGNIGYYYFLLSMTTVTCKIPEGLNAKLELIAKKNRVSKSQVMREALERRAKAASRKAAPRAIDLVRHLRGSLRGGPGDLSANPEHMKGFGA